MLGRRTVRDFHRGQPVKVISQSYGWGSVSMNDTGTVRQVMDDKITVDFPIQRNWACKPKDLEPVVDHTVDLPEDERKAADIEFYKPLALTNKGIVVKHPNPNRLYALYIPYTGRLIEDLDKETTMAIERELVQAKHFDENLFT
jgi:hypothetical protein